MIMGLIIRLFGEKENPPKSLFLFFFFVFWKIKEIFSMVFPGNKTSN